MLNDQPKGVRVVDMELTGGLPSVNCPLVSFYAIKCAEEPTMKNFLIAHQCPSAARLMALLSLFLFAGSHSRAQGNSHIEVTLTEQGKSVGGALVVLQRLKDADCAKTFSNPDASAKAQRKLESCEVDLPEGNTDANGKYAFQQLAPGWYDIRFLWSMEKAPDRRQSIACKTETWGVFYEPGRDRTGKYDAMAQGSPFELKEGESRQVSFEYQNQFEAANCLSNPADAGSAPKTGQARISFPGKRGVLEVDPGPTPWQMTVKNGGAEIYLSAINRPDHLLITAFVRQVAFSASAETCRKELWHNEENALRTHNLRPEHIRKTMQNGVARVEFLIDHSPTGKLEMEDVHTYMGSGDVCAEVHLSKVYFKAEETKLFDEVLATVRFVPDETGKIAMQPQ